ncbi:MAG: phage integrase SAM-like domain-containing protein, partial [Faecalibacterium sp.]
MKDTQQKQGSISPKNQSNKPITLASFAQTWLSGVENLRYPRRALDVTYILRYLGQCEVQTLTPQLVRNFYATLATETTLAFTTREGVHITLSAICNSAIAAGHLKYNPCFHSFSYAA